MSREDTNNMNIVPRVRQNKKKTYRMIIPHERNIIIQKIDNGEFDLIITENEMIWWGRGAQRKGKEYRKHAPDEEIPKNIYLLGNGTLKELYNEYIKKHTYLEWRQFLNYTRELQKQKIMI